LLLDPAGPNAQGVIDKVNVGILPFLPHWDAAMTRSVLP
jgi:hypothetical protein